MKIVEKIVMTLVVLLVISAILSMIDKYYYGSIYAHSLIYSSDCEYTVPAGYKIKYSEQERAYAVQDLTLYGDCYLVDRSYGITYSFISVEKPSLFNNECQARNYLKSYLKQREPKVNDFK